MSAVSQEAEEMVEMPTGLSDDEAFDWLDEHDPINSPSTTSMKDPVKQDPDTGLGARPGRIRSFE